MTTSRPAPQDKRLAPEQATPPNRSLPAQEVEAQNKVKGEFDEKEPDLGEAKNEADDLRK